jgi:hypothetical protein|tara:strand:- start:818 stop:1036 length:219 start_codon:yes stop_codon:yes gene_type:complete
MNKYEIKFVAKPLDKKRCFVRVLYNVENETNILHFSEEKMQELKSLFPNNSHDIQIQYIKKVYELPNGKEST